MKLTEGVEGKRNPARPESLELFGMKLTTRQPEGRNAGFTHPPRERFALLSTDMSKKLKYRLRDTAL